MKNTRVLNQTWEFKLKPTREQVTIIEQTLDVCRSVWNFALRERKDWLNSRKSPVNACSIIHEYVIPPDEPYPNYHTQAKRLMGLRQNLSPNKSQTGFISSKYVTIEGQPIKKSIRLPLF
jgi:putative transposase